MSELGKSAPGQTRVNTACYPWQSKECYTFDQYGLTLIRKTPYSDTPYESVVDGQGEIVYPSASERARAERLDLLNRAIGQTGAPSEIKAAYANFFGIARQYLDMQIS